MRSIEVSTETFARIWALRAEGEESEDAILRRILGGGGSPEPKAERAPLPLRPPQSPMAEVYNRGPRTWSKPTWATDIAEVLLARGGKARLQHIYEDVEKLRRREGRSVPPSLDATVRRTLENYSTDSHNYTGGPDLFCMPDGKGAGTWALRSK